jgi:NitT/TauT family transport system substrate-binding protein
LFAGAVDIGYIGPGPAINGYAKSKGDLQILAGATDSGAILVSRKDMQPRGSTLVKDLKANVVLDYNKLWREGNYTTAVVVVRTQFLKEHPDLVEKFLKNHVELTDYINNNKFS